jgi:hypothetical protein
MEKGTRVEPRCQPRARKRWRCEEKQERRRNEWSTGRPRVLREVVGIEIQNAADFFFIHVKASACVDVRPQFLMIVI